MAIPEERKERALAIYNNIRDFYDSKMAEMRSHWHDYYRNYRGILTREKYKGAANTFIMETHNAVETLASRIRRLVLSVEPPFDVESSSPDPSGTVKQQERARIVKEKLACQWRNAHIAKHVDMAIRTMEIYGTCIMKYFWQVKNKTIIVNGEEKTVQEYDDVAFETKDPFNIYLIGQGETAGELEGIMERIETTVEELKKNERKSIGKGKDKKTIGVYENLDDVGNVTLGENVDANRRSLTKYRMRVSPDEIDREEKSVEMFELWIDFDYEGDGKKVPCVIAIANGVVIRVQKNPFWHQRKPYVICPFIPLKDEPWGIGLCELTYYDQAIMNDLYNQMLDDATFTLHNMWTRKIGCPTLKSQLRAAPNRVFEVRNKDDITPLPTAGGAIMQTAIAAQRVVRDNINNTTGNQPILQGQPLRSRTTATEVQGQERHGLAKIVDIADRFSERIIQPLVEATFELDRQFMDNPGLVRIDTPKGQVFRKMLFEDLDFDYQFRVIGAMDVENKMVKMQQLIGFLNILRGFPPQAMGKPVMFTLKEIMQSMGFKNVDEIITPQIEQVFLQMVGAEQQGGAQRAGQLGDRAGGAGPLAQPAMMPGNLGGAVNTERFS